MIELLAIADALAYVAQHGDMIEVGDPVTPVNWKQWTFTAGLAVLVDLRHYARRWLTAATVERERRAGIVSPEIREQESNNNNNAAEPPK